MASNVDSKANVATIAGPLFLGTCFTWGLFGLHSSQLYTYYTHTRPSSRRDPTVLWLMVYFIYLIGVAQVAFVTHDTYMALAIGFGDVDALSRTYFTWLSAPVYSSIVALLVHMFYAHGIYLISYRSFITPILIMLLALLQWGSGLASGIIASQKESVVGLNLFVPIRVVQAIWTVASAACDVIIALCMAYYLRRSKSTWPSTQAIISKLLKSIVGYGTLTAAVAIATLFLFNFAEDSLLFSPSSTILGRLYSSSMMVLLNGRESSSDNIFQNTSPLSSISFSESSYTPSLADSKTSHWESKVIKEMEPAAIFKVSYLKRVDLLKLPEFY